jgi:hypothetical protein
MASKRAWWVCAWVLAGGGACAEAPFLIETIPNPSPSSDPSPVVGVDDAGDATMVWRSHSPGSLNMRARRRPAGGDWAPLATLGPAGGRYPALAVSGNGDAMAWRDNGSWSRYANGNWTPVTMSPSPGTIDPHQGLAADGNGHFFAAWLDDQGSVRASRYAPGAGWAAQQGLGFGGAAQDVGVSANAGGEAVVVWGDGSPTNQAGVWVARYSGGAWLGAEQVHSSAVAARPAVAIAGNGDVLVVWTGANSVTARWRSGGAWQSKKVLDSVGAARVLAAADTTGAAVVAWHNATPTKPLLMQAYSPGGGWLPAALTVGTGLDDMLFSLAVAEKGNAFFVFHKSQQIWSNRYVAAAGVGNQYAIKNTTNGYNPRVATSPSGTAYAVWQISADTVWALKL